MGQIYNGLCWRWKAVGEDRTANFGTEAPNLAKTIFHASYILIQCTLTSMARAHNGGRVIEGVCECGKKRRLWGCPHGRLAGVHHFGHILKLEHSKNKRKIRSGSWAHKLQLLWRNQLQLWMRYGRKKLGKSMYIVSPKSLAVVPPFVNLFSMYLKEFFFLVWKHLLGPWITIQGGA